MRTGGRHLLALASAALSLGLSAPPASAASSEADLRTATIALGQEAADLVALHAFASDDQLNALQAGLEGLSFKIPSGRLAQIAQLKADDRTGTVALKRLTGALSREVRVSLGPLTSSQLGAVSRGARFSQPKAGLYLEALDDLVERQGGPGSPGSRPDPGIVNNGLAQALNQGPTGPGAGPVQTATPRPTGSPRSSSLPWVIAGIVALALVAFAAMRRPSRQAASVSVRPAPAPVPVHSVLDASRRLTTLTGDDSMPRAIVREALALVPGLAAAMVERQLGELVLAHESQPGVLRPEGFHAGAIEAAANAGQVTAQLVTNDPSFSRQPAQVLLLPLVSGGRVDAVVVIVRDANHTFTTAERETLATFAPVAASARESAARTQAAIDASQIDPLTGAGNRRQLDTHLPVVLREAAGDSTGFCMIDLDHFKTVNDTFGHPAGDAMLRAVCATIRSAVRPTDGVYRYGGEEFCVLLPATTLEETADIAERVRAAIASTRYDVGSAKPLAATASLGVAVTTADEVGDLIDRADRALYEAKVGGRNQVRRG